MFSSLLDSAAVPPLCGGRRVNPFLLCAFLSIIDVFVMDVVVIIANKRMKNC